MSYPVVCLVTDSLLCRLAQTKHQSSIILCLRHCRLVKHQIPSRNVINIPHKLNGAGVIVRLYTSLYQRERRHADFILCHQWPPYPTHTLSALSLFLSLSILSHFLSLAHSLWHSLSPSYTFSLSHALCHFFSLKLSFTLSLSFSLFLSLSLPPSPPSLPSPPPSPLSD